MDDEKQLNQAGLLYLQRGEYQQAEESFLKILTINPTSSVAHINLAIAYLQSARYEKAIEYAKIVVKQSHHTSKVYQIIGQAYQASKQYQLAIDAFIHAIHIEPNQAEYYVELALAYFANDQLTLASDNIKQAVYINPKLLIAYYNANVIMASQHQYREYIDLLYHGIEQAPDEPQLTYLLYNALRTHCLWDDLSCISAIMDRQTHRALLQNQVPAESPMTNICRIDHPELNYQIAKAWSTALEKKMLPMKQLLSSKPKPQHAQTKIILAYICADFKDHATAAHIVKMIKLHDRKTFTVMLFSCGQDNFSTKLSQVVAPQSFYRQQLMANCDKFIDLQGCDPVAIANSINAYGVHILVELVGGYNKFSQDVIYQALALKPAPIQVSYLGFPGTCGANFIDYLIADKITVPENEQIFFAEKLLYLPNCYQVNDNEKPISTQPINRQQYGLPDNALVFCSFNAVSKLTPEIFNIWIKLLANVENSVLWLYRLGSEAELNLKQLLQKNSIASDRLVIADFVTKPMHSQRLQLADIALDTFPCGGHTTTSDALWAGVPVIALKGRHFASRVSASLLTSLQMPELITTSTHDYYQLALSLATHADTLAAIKRKIWLNRLTTPLFNTEQFTINLDAIYLSLCRE